jgi:hypothetical protein
MISHIYVALGRWHESVAANVKSYQVSVERAEKKNLGVDARNYHALHWLQYSYLQLGRFAEAREELELMRPMAAESRSPRALWYYAAMRAGLIVESGVAFPTPPSLGGEGVLGAEVLDTFGTGYAAAKRGEAGAAAARRQPRPDCAKPSRPPDPGPTRRRRDFWESPRRIGTAPR